MKQKIISSLVMIILLSSCKKAGLGGDNIIIAYPQHHGKSIFSQSTPNYRDTIYVKFNATELPSTNPKDFDKAFIGEVGKNYVQINGLQIGKYFLYGVGWDTTGPYRVSGGIPIELKQLTAKTIINVPVTE